METISNALKRHFRPGSNSEQPGTNGLDVDGGTGRENTIQDGDLEKSTPNETTTEAGVAGIEATAAVWGKKGRWLVIAG